jgi:DNA-binding transcriptional regulator GbsR (MarR family)
MKTSPDKHSRKYSYYAENVENCRLQFTRDQIKRTLELPECARIEQMAPHFFAQMNKLSESERKIMLVFANNSKPISQARIADISGCSAPYVYIVCNHLLNEGFICKSQKGKRFLFEIVDPDFLKFLTMYFNEDFQKKIESGEIKIPEPDETGMDQKPITNFLNEYDPALAKLKRFKIRILNEKRDRMKALLAAIRINISKMETQKKELDLIMGVIGQIEGGGEMKTPKPDRAGKGQRPITNFPNKFDPAQVNLKKLKLSILDEKGVKMKNLLTKISKNMSRIETQKIELGTVMDDVSRLEKEMIELETQRAILEKEVIESKI